MSAPRPHRLALALLMCASLAACNLTRSRQFSREELLGTYEIRYDFGVETLVLREDGLYEQRFVDGSGKVFTAEGKWTYHGGKENQIDIENPMPILDPFGRFGSTTPQRAYSFRTFRWNDGAVIDLIPDRTFLMRKTK
jgi:hypothetical protein